MHQSHARLYAGRYEGALAQLQSHALARTPKLLNALCDFAQGQRGTDNQRMQAGQVAREAGLLLPKVRLWVKGEQQELLLMGFQIHHSNTS
jgi:hypothetical protein